MTIQQILSQKPSLYNEWFASYDILRKFTPAKEIWGVASPPKGATHQNSFFVKF